MFLACRKYYYFVEDLIPKMRLTKWGDKTFVEVSNCRSKLVIKLWTFINLIIPSNSVKYANKKNPNMGSWHGVHLYNFFNEPKFNYQRNFTCQMKSYLEYLLWELLVILLEDGWLMNNIMMRRVPSPIKINYWFYFRQN